MIYRAALVGCGAVGWTMADDPLMAGDIFTHAQAYDISKKINFVAVCDQSLDAANACANRFDVPHAYDDLSDMLVKERPEIVSVATPDATHAEIVRKIMDTGKSVKAIMCEKPIALSLHDASEMIERAEERGIALTVMYLRRHAENLSRLRDYLRSGVIGEILAITGWYGKGVLHNGVHWFDQLRMLGGEVAWVEAADNLDEGGSDPTLDVTLGMVSGAVATLRAVSDARFTIFECDIITERGRVLIKDSGHRVEIFHAGPSKLYSGYFELEHYPIDLGTRRDVMLRAVEALCESLDNHQRPISSGQEAIAPLRIAAMAIEAAKTDKRIALASFTKPSSTQ